MDHVIFVFICPDFLGRNAIGWCFANDHPVSSVPAARLFMGCSDSGPTLFGQKVLEFLAFPVYRDSAGIEVEFTGLLNGIVLSRDAKIAGGCTLAEEQGLSGTVSLCMTAAEVGLTGLMGLAMEPLNGFSNTGRI